MFDCFFRLGRRDRPGARCQCFFRERAERHESLRRPMEGRQSGRHDERRDLAAVPRPMSRAAVWRRCPGSEHIRAYRLARTSAGCWRGNDDEPVRCGILGQQGRDQGVGSDQEGIRRGLPGGQCDDPARYCSSASAATGPSVRADRLALSLAATDRSSASTRPAPAPANYGSAPAPTGAGEFATEQQARYRCPSGTIVWVNTKSRIYHFAGTSNYGNTKHGAYMCEQDAQAAGDRAAMNEHHP